MLPDLDRLIRLQKLDTTAEDARRRIADHPQRIQALDQRLETAQAAVDAARSRLTDLQAARRENEKEAAAAQSRLAKYKDQLLEVKTNREYTAMLSEISTAEGDVSRHETAILERMLEADTLTAAAKAAEADLATAQAEVKAERATLETEVRALEQQLEELTAARTALVAELSAPILDTFETVARGRKGIAVAEARDGLCTVCHVRLRPQVFNELRANAAIIQCDSCRRILYFVPTPAGPAAEPAAASAAAKPGVPPSQGGS